MQSQDNCDSTVNDDGGQDDHHESGNPQEPSEVEVRDLSDVNSEEWSDTGDDSSSESDSGVDAIATHAHASQPLSSKISANIH